VVDPSELGQLESLADAFHESWRAGAEQRRFAPMASEPIDETRYGRFAKRLVLTVPSDVDLAACDGGEYRMWEDLEGRARVARGPGERIRLWVVDLSPGLLVVDASTLPSTSSRDRDRLNWLIPTVWVERPASDTGP
jgi:hypothetical protein